MGFPLELWQYVVAVFEFKAANETVVILCFGVSQALRTDEMSSYFRQPKIEGVLFKSLAVYPLLLLVVVEVVELVAISGDTEARI